MLQKPPSMNTRRVRNGRVGTGLATGVSTVCSCVNGSEATITARSRDLARMTEVSPRFSTIFASQA